MKLTMKKLLSRIMRTIAKPASRKAGQRQPGRFRPWCEQLEDRLAPSTGKTFTRPGTTTPVTNTAPVLAAISNQAVNELALLSITATATDADVPAQTLTYSLASGPAGATMSAGGLFQWTPTEAQGPGTYSATVKVTDNGVGNLSDSKTFTITVNEVDNFAPVLAFIPNKTVNEGSGPLTFAITATDSDLPAPSLTYSLTGTVPAGASITPGGTFTYTNTGDGSRTVSVTARVTDGTLSASQTFTITIQDVAPTLGLSGSSHATKSSPYALSLGTVTDPGQDTVSAYSIKWGDGSTSNLTGNPGGKTVNHIYGVAGTYNISVGLTNEDGTFSGAGSKTVIVDIGTVSSPLSSSVWVAEGPGPGINGQENVPPNDQITGAIQAVAVDPSNANNMYVGTVNGGIWKTTNATAANPTWTPQTDNFPSLSIGAIEYDPLDGTHQTLIAGIGHYSSFGAVGGSLNGLLYTTNGGTTWTQLTNANLLGQDFASVAARGSILLAASDSTWGGGGGNGLYRSIDSGASFTLISGTNGLPAGSVSDLVGDPLTPTTFYASVVGAGVGVYKSTDSGATWTNVSTGITGLGGTTRRIEMAVYHVGATTSVFVGVLNALGSPNGTQLVGVFRSLNGAAFASMDVPSPNPNSGGQGDVHFAIAAEPSNPNIVYIAGDSGNRYREDASLAAGSQATQIDSTTSPHPDNRDMIVMANGDLVDTTDGGIFRLSTPTTNTGTWSSLIGNLAVFEFHDIAYDAISHVIIGGAQDNGTLDQQSTGSQTWDHPGFGDGGDVLVDNVTLAGSNQSIRYFSSQNLGGFTRAVYDQANNLVSSNAINTAVVGADAQFVTPLAINAIDPHRIIIGGANNTYESLNQGTTITNIGAGVGVNGSYVQGAIAYGGQHLGVNNPDVLYVGFQSGVFVRTISGGALNPTAALPGGGDFVNGIVLDPTDWMTAYVIDQNQVFQTTNAGASWTDITGNLLGIGAVNLLSIEFVPGAQNMLVVGTNAGVFSSFTTSLTTWAAFGTGLPNAPVFELKYNLADDVLVAGTFGRGAWEIQGPSNSPPVLAAIPNKTVNELSLLSFTATATDPDAGQTLTFSLTGAVPAGASITAGGLFQWTPTEAQGPGS